MSGPVVSLANCWWRESWYFNPHIYVSWMLIYTQASCLDPCSEDFFSSFPSHSVYSAMHSSPSAVNPSISFSGFSVGFCINEEEGYLLPNPSILPCSPQVVKMKGTEKVYALKILNKWEMLKRHQVSASLIPKPCSISVSFPDCLYSFSGMLQSQLLLI